MHNYNLWIIRAVIGQLRRPDRGAQRRFMLGAGIALATFLCWAFVYLSQQATEQDLEQAALTVFAAMGLLVVVIIGVAFVVRRKTRARWET